MSRALLVVDNRWRGTETPPGPAGAEEGDQGTCPRGTCSDPATALVLDALAIVFPRKLKKKKKLQDF